MKLISKQQLEEKATVKGTHQDSSCKKENEEIHVISLMASGEEQQHLRRAAGKYRTHSRISRPPPSLTALNNFMSRLQLSSKAYLLYRRYLKKSKQNSDPLW